MAGAPVGNQNAVKAKIWEGALRRALIKRAAGDLNAGLDKLADRFLDACEAGEQWALIELGNRFDGKPAQAIIGGSPDDPPLSFVGRIERAVIRANAKPADR